MTTKEKKSKYRKDDAAIELLETAVRSLADYYDHCPRQSYQRHVIGEPLRELKALLREERRGWTDL